MDKKSDLLWIYFFFLGLLLLFVAVLQSLTVFSDFTVGLGFVKIPEMFSLWRALVLGLAGLIYISGVVRPGNIYSRSRTVLASIMVWIVGGLDIFDISITALRRLRFGAEYPVYFFGGRFVETIAPPYHPALYLLPFTLVALCYFYPGICGSDSE